MLQAIDQESIPRLDELLRRLGDVPLKRILLRPFPGTATEKDAKALLRRKCLVELIDGVLVEKPMGMEESSLTMWIGYLLLDFLKEHKLGFIAGADGALRLKPGLIRIPDVSYISWKTCPREERPLEAVPKIAPDLAIEVLSKSNRPGEIKRKLRDLFQAGTKLAWVVDPRKQTVRVYTTATAFTPLTIADTLDGGEVLPGFTTTVQRLFATLEDEAGGS